MFEAFILICSINNPDNCSIMKNTTGLYKDYNSCYSRVLEMTEIAKNKIGNVFPKNYACVKIDSSKKNKIKI
tara:strand:+ start:295 stop:510 length:216 start_codon:yes stop_codon:yes gene_type:complete